MKIRIIQDSDAANPRKEFDHVGTIAHWHRRYDLGDRKATDDEMRALQAGGFALLARYLRRFHDVAVLLPVNLLDHSGLHIWTGSPGPHWSDSAGWDSGPVGFIYCTAKQLTDEWAGDRDKAIAYLQGEIKEYDQYLSGDVYGFIVERNDETEDSCFGFYGHNPKTNGMWDHWDRVARSWWARFGHRVQVGE